MATEQSFWKDKKVLITGHSGFKGMWLSIILKKLGSELVGISKENSNCFLYGSYINKDIFTNEYFCDLSSDKNKLLDKVLQEQKFDIVFHLAAQALVPEAFKNPQQTLMTNIMGTFNFISLILENNVTNSLVVATTDKVYKYPKNKNTEESHLGGHEFYSASKVSQEMVLEAFKSLDINLSISTVRSGNVLGPGDGAEGRIVTDIIFSLKNNLDIILRQPNSIRPWQDILDSLYGYILIAEQNYKNKVSEIYNLNSDLNKEVSVLNIANKFLNQWGSTSNIVHKSEKVFHESEELRLDSSKAIKNLGWESSIKIDEIISKICEWEKAESLKSKAEIIDKQIDLFFANK